MSACPECHDNAMHHCSICDISMPDHEAIALIESAAAKDAARYRWLRDPENYPDDNWFDTLAYCDDGQSFDAAIDEAIARATTLAPGSGEG